MCALNLVAKLNFARFLVRDSPRVGAFVHGRKIGWNKLGKLG